jgi:hypothetical protein
MTGSSGVWITFVTPLGGAFQSGDAPLPLLAWSCHLGMRALALKEARRLGQK